MKLDREQLETFVMVLDEGGFERAAIALRVSQSAVSQRIRALEQAVGSALLVRVTPPRPTPAGNALLRHVRHLRLMEAQFARQLVPSRDGMVTLAVAVNADSLATWFPAAMEDIWRREGLLLDLMVDDQAHTHDWLRRGEVSGCVTSLAEPIAGCEAKPLGAFRYACVATPAFAAQWFDGGLRATNWQTAPAIVYDRKDSMHAEFIRRRFGVSNARFPSHAIPSPETFFEAIRRGIGYGFVPLAQLGDMLNSGAVIDLAPEYRPRISLYWQHWSLEPEPAQRLTQAVIAMARAALEPLSDTD
jgi:LysR family transcriptional regulator (chromosome initiation inhibitor)